MGKNPRLIRGDPAHPIQLARGLKGRTRISSYVEQGWAAPPADPWTDGHHLGQGA